MAKAILSHSSIIRVVFYSLCFDKTHIEYNIKTDEYESVIPQ
ncbi:hypothetical protein yfred0001_40560 [Yersinia frederiksenii ATCC 33641]|nr:hypothetical protein yfred0001_40560 [Yersinia frederiksenii ATCC 33641]